MFCRATIAALGLLAAAGPALGRDAPFEPRLAHAGMAGSPQPDAAPVERAARLLSRYPRGRMPLHPDIVDAVSTLARHGGPAEVPLLRSLAAAEREEIREVSEFAISRIRLRQRDVQRMAYAQTLPDWPEVEEAAAHYRAVGLGSEEAACAAYASLVLPGDPARVEGLPGEVEGDAEAMLAEGLPRKALAITLADARPEARHLEARAREELGDLGGALRQYATLAATGDRTAQEALDAFGIDSERLLLGMLADPGAKLLEPHKEPAVVEVLVREGDRLTAKVLAERSRSSSVVDRTIATDALGRRLAGHRREQPLQPSSRQIARQALEEASRSGPEPLRRFALEALE